VLRPSLDDCEERTLKRVRRGRPPNTARREAILDSAERLFAFGAFSGVRMHDIAAAANIRDTLLYRYFPKKDRIADALVERAGRLTRTFVENARQRFGRGHVTHATLAELGLIYCRSLHDAYNLYHAWFAMPERFEPCEAEISKDGKLLLALVTSMFQRASGTRLERQRAPRLALAYLDTLCANVMRDRRVGRVDDETLARHVADTTALFARWFHDA
jgi:AcrR family transcriptional regulator